MRQTKSFKSHFIDLCRYGELPVSLRRGLLLLLIAAPMFGSVSCGKIDGRVRSVFNRPDPADDFKKSEIITNGPAAADGQSELLVVIQLTNSNGKPVQSYRPVYEIVAGLGVTASECTTSNANGVSTCVLKATKSGTKRLAVTNIKIPLEKDVVFTDPPIGKSMVGLISAGQKLSSDQHQFTGIIGSQEPGVVKTSGSYKFYGGVQGEAFSR